MRGEEAAQLLLVHLLGHRHQIRPHDRVDFLVGLGRDEVSVRDHAQELVIRGEDVGVGERRPPVRGVAPQVGDRLVHGHVRPQARVARVHQPTGVVLGIGQEPAHFLARRLVEERHQGLALLRGNFLHQIRGVVGRQEPDPGAPLRGRQAQEQVRLIVRAQAQEEVLGLRALEGPEAFQPI